MLNEENNIDEQYYRDLIVTKLTYERCERYISCARALLHINDDQGAALNLEDKRLFKNLWHILDLISIELNSLTERLDEG